MLSDFGHWIFKFQYIYIYTYIQYISIWYVYYGCEIHSGTSAAWMFQFWNKATNFRWRTFRWHSPPENSRMSTLKRNHFKRKGFMFQALFSRGQIWVFGGVISWGEAAGREMSAISHVLCWGSRERSPVRVLLIQSSQKCRKFLSKHFHETWFIMWNPNLSCHPSSDANA